MTFFSSLIAATHRALPRALLAAALGASGILLGCAERNEETLFVPGDAAAVIAELPRREGAQWREIDALRSELMQRPSATVAARLVNRYLDQFRIDGDPRLLGYAAAVLAPWSTTTAPLDISLQRAALAGLQHRFTAAAEELDALLERSPRDPQLWLSRSALHLVRGEYAASEQACRKLVFLHDPVVAGACLSAVQALTGRAEQAYDFLDGRLQAPGPGLDPTLSVWLATLAAETAVGLGDEAAADEHFSSALAMARRGSSRPDSYLFTAYADFLLERGRAGAALALLDDAAVNDSVVLRQARAKLALGKPADEELKALGYRLQLALGGQDYTHAREAAYFALYLNGDAERALPLALENWAVQHEPLDAVLVLESAVALCARAQAAPVLTWLSENAVEHPQLAAAARQLGKCT